MIDPDQESVEQYLLQESGYDMVVKTKSGIIESVVVEGFEIPVRAIFDSAQQFVALQAILG